MTYEEKLQIANDYLLHVVGVTWEDLPDINSLHDAEDEDGVIELCDERIDDNNFF